jgi:hypothetical protein
VNSAVNKEANELNRYILKELQMANKRMKKCLTSLTFREMQIKLIEIPSHPSWRSYHQENSHAAEDVGKTNPYTLLTRV